MLSKYAKCRNVGPFQTPFEVIQHFFSDPSITHNDDHFTHKKTALKLYEIQILKFGFERERKSVDILPEATSTINAKKKKTTAKLDENNNYKFNILSKYAKFRNFGPIYEIKQQKCVWFIKAKKLNIWKFPPFIFKTVIVT